MQSKTRNILVIFVGIVLIGALSFLFANIIQKRDADVTTACKAKEIIGGNDTYPIAELPSGGTIAMRIPDRSNENWQVALAPIQKPETEFDTCEASIYKASPDVLGSPDTPQETKENLSRGLTVSIGRETSIQFEHIADITLRIFLSANRNTTESFDLDDAIKHLSEQFILKSQGDGTLQLVVAGNVQENLDNGKKFYYEVVELNGEWMGERDIILTSNDKGKSWKASLYDSK